MREEHEETLLIPAGRRELEGELEFPADPKGLVIFAHGSGSNQKALRDPVVAAALRARGLGTFLCELLTPEEERAAQLDPHPHFDLPLLASRLGEVTQWLRGRRAVTGLRLGYFGAGVGAAAALVWASRRPRAVQAVVSRGGRPDLAREVLARVQAPTLMIVGSDDPTVLELNEDALGAIPAPRRLEVVGGASHLFREPGALEEVARLAAGWFLEHLAEPAHAGAHAHF